MKFVIDKDIPFIKDRFPNNIDIKYAAGNEINPDDVRDADALIIRTRTKCDENLLRDSKVRLIATATIGTDHIDLTWCESKGIKIKNAPGCNAPGVAQYVLSSLFHIGFNPHNDILGIVGLGNVGTIVSNWAKELGIQTIISDNPKKEQGCSDADYKSLDEVLENSDAVTLHVPLSFTGSHPTYKLIGKKELDKMKNGAILVNSSRGGVVDEKALKKAIKEYDLKAVVDVWENEPSIDKELSDLALVSTPHIAGYSAEGKKRATAMVLQAIKNEFDINVDLSGLECIPRMDLHLSDKILKESYNPLIDCKNLLRDISKFEALRNNYSYRHEPFFN